MTDKPLVLDVPEDLLVRAQAAHVDMRRVVIEALEKEVRRTQASQEMDEIVQTFPPRDELEAAIQQSMQRVASGETKLRTLGLHAGTTWIADDFDDPLPDEIWGDLFA